MAITPLRKRTAVSYRESSSSSGDLSDEATSTTTPRRRSKFAATRRSVRENRVNGGDSPVVASQDVASNSNTLGGRIRGRSQRISYKDASSDDGEIMNEEFLPNQVADTPRQRARRTAVPSPRPAPHRRSPAKRSRPTKQRLSRSLGAPLKAKSESGFIPTVVIPSDGNVPDWASLPYHVLLQIFVYAAHPLHNENMVGTPAILWLSNIARTCRAFVRPALTALYRNPPIHALKHSRSALVHRLMDTSTQSSTDYEVMVKRLALDATQMTSLKDPLHIADDLAALISRLSTVREIDIFDPIDRPPYRLRLKPQRRWTYPRELYTALQEGKLRLHAWKWKAQYLSRGFEEIESFHALAAFQSLRALTFTRFSAPKVRKEEPESDDFEQALAQAISNLPNIKSLTFESCDAINSKLLPMLPHRLASLSINNCIYLMSDALKTFLAERGSDLEILVLNHNQSLDLSFLVHLKASCPKLEVLTMDLNYYSSLVMSSDNEPLYDWLLDVDDIPSWPTSLRVIDMENLRHWSSHAATNFFTSLIEAAAELPWLRELRIGAMVDTDWRQRAKFRQRWAARFERVFANRDRQPSPHLVSFRAYRDWRASELDLTELPRSLPILTHGGITEGSPTKASRDAANEKRKKFDEDHWSNKRLRTRQTASTYYDQTSSEELGSASDRDDDGANDQIQGLCHTVVLRLDNLRPREELYIEADFLDSERSGDEDWNGNDGGDDGYAW